MTRDAAAMMTTVSKPRMIIELAADDVAVSPVAHLRLAQTPGPPYPVTFTIERDDRWPAVSLTIGLDGGGPLMTIQTTEPRLKATLHGVLEELVS